MHGDSLGRPKEFLLHDQPARLSYPSPRRLDSTGIFYSPLPTGTDDLRRRHISRLDRSAGMAVRDSNA